MNSQNLVIFRPEYISGFTVMIRKEDSSGRKRHWSRVQLDERSWLQLMYMPQSLVVRLVVYFGVEGSRQNRGSKEVE